MHRSDSIAIYEAYKRWESLGRKDQETFCRDNFLSSVALRSMGDFRKQIIAILNDIGYIQRSVDMNANSGNYKLVKAVLTAGLYPNMAAIQTPEQKYEQTGSGSVAVLPKSSEIKFFTKTDGRVFIHPSSLLFKERAYEDKLVMYGNKVNTSKIFLRDCTVVPTISLLLLGGELELKHEGHTLVIDNLRFRAFPRVTGISLLTQC